MQLDTGPLGACAGALDGVAPEHIKRPRVGQPLVPHVHELGCHVRACPCRQVSDALVDDCARAWVPCMRTSLQTSFKCLGRFSNRIYCSGVRDNSVMWRFMTLPPLQAPGTGPATSSRLGTKLTDEQINTLTTVGQQTALSNLPTQAQVGNLGNQVVPVLQQHVGRLEVHVHNLPSKRRR